MQAHMFGYDQNTKCSSTREDDNRIRQGHAQHNLAILRRLALNLLRREKNAKIGMAAKRQRAGWKTDYLLKSSLPIRCVCPGQT